MGVCRRADPSLTFIYILYQSGRSIEPKPMTNLINGLVSVSDRTILDADAQHSKRWGQPGPHPVRCKGVVPFYTNETCLRQQLETWFNTCDSCIPRSVDYLTGKDFSETLKFYAEELKLCCLRSYVLVGGEEDEA